MRLADKTSGYVCEVYGLGYFVRSLCATGALNPVLSTITTRLPLCMFLISEANDDIDVGGLNASVKEPYSKDPYFVCVPGQPRVTFSALNMRASLRREFSQSLGSHLEFVGGC